MKKFGIGIGVGRIVVVTLFFGVVSVRAVPNVLDVVESFVELEDVESDDVMGWNIGGTSQGYFFKLDSSEKYSGEHSARLQSLASWNGGFGCLTQEFNAKKFRGKTICYRAYVKTSNVVDSCGLWMRIDDADWEVVGFDNMGDRPITGTTDWTQYEIKMDVPQGGEEICIGLLLTGPGRAWIDHVEVLSGDEEVVPASESWLMANDTKEYPRNLDFDSKENDEPLNAELMADPMGRKYRSRDVDDRPKHWLFGGSAAGEFTFIADTNHPVEGAYCARIDATSAYKQGYGTLHQSFYANAWHGRTLELTGELFVSNLTGIAEIWIRADDKNGNMLTFDSLEKHGQAVRETPDGWVLRSVHIMVPQKAHKISIGILLNGKGTVWADNLALRCIPETKVAIHEQPPECRPFNLNFEDGYYWTSEREEALLYKVVNAPALKPALTILDSSDAWNCSISCAESLTAGDWDGDGRSEILISDMHERLYVLNTAGKTVDVFNIPQRFTKMELGMYEDDARLLGYFVWSTNTPDYIRSSLVRVLKVDGELAWTYDGLMAINGAHWVDVNGDGNDEMIVGNNASMGLSLVASDGTLVWNYNEIVNVWNQAAVRLSGDGHVVIGATAADDYIHIFDAAGHPIRAFKPDDLSYTQLYACQADEGNQAQFLSVATTSFEIDGCLYGVGMWMAFDQYGNEAWRAPMDYEWGIWRERFAVAGDFTGDGKNEWAVFNGKDGITLITLDGKELCAVECREKCLRDMAYVPLENGGALAILECDCLRYIEFERLQPDPHS